MRASRRNERRVSTKASGALVALPAALLLSTLAAPGRADELPSPKALEPPEQAKAKAEPGDFGIRSADGKFSLKIGGYTQADGRFYLHDEASALTNTFLMRRVRPVLSGTVFGRFDYRIMPDFGSGQTVLYDAYTDVRLIDTLRIRAGKFKPPVGIERLQSATAIAFIERGLPTDLVPTRDIGLQIYGNLFRNRLAWAFGVFNGVPNGGNADSDVDDAKDLEGRLFAEPLRGLGIAPLEGLGIGISGTWGRETGTQSNPNLPSLKSPGQQTFFTYATGTPPATTAVAAGALARVSPQLYYHYGPLGVLSELVLTWQAVQRGTSHARLRQRAWQVLPSWVIYGGDASYEGVKPFHAVGAGGIGAFEIAGRYHELHVSPDTFPIFADPTKSASAAKAWGVGINWYATSSYRLAVNFDHTTFEGGAANQGDRPAENFLSARVQIVL